MRKIGCHHSLTCGRTLQEKENTGDTYQYGEKSARQTDIFSAQ